MRLDDVTFLHLSHHKHELIWISLNVSFHKIIYTDSDLFAFSVDVSNSNVL